MDEHLTAIRYRVASVHAFCVDHGAVGRSYPGSRYGRNAAIIDARDHDVREHGVYRSEFAYETAGQKADEKGGE